MSWQGTKEIVLNCSFAASTVISSIDSLHLSVPLETLVRWSEHSFELCIMQPIVHAHVMCAVWAHQTAVMGGTLLSCPRPPLFSTARHRCRPSERAPHDSTQDRIPIQTVQSLSSLFIFLDYHQICVTSKAALLTRSDALPLLLLLLVDMLTFSYVSLLMPANCADRITWELNR